MANKIKILIAEHDKHDLEILEHELVKGGFNYESKIVKTENDFSDALENFVPDIILSDYTFPSFDGPTAFKIREQLAHDTPFIFVSGTIGEEAVVELIKTGVTDYALKDKLFTLPNKINRALRDSEKVKEYKHAQELFVKNEKRFRALIEKSSDMKMLADENGNIIYASPSVEKVLGCTLEEILQTKVFNFIHPEDKTAYLEKRKKLIGVPGASFFIELRFLCKNGDWTWCEGTITNLLDDPSINALVSNFRNISERKEMEMKRVFEENNLNALINNTEDLMWSVDRNFNLITANKPFEEMSMAQFGRVILKGENILAAAYTPEMLEHFKGFYERAFSGETFTEISHFEVPFEFWTEISYYPIRKGDEIVGTACYSRDITKAKLSEALLKKSESFTKGILNSLRSHIAVIDPSGTIVAVNESWKQFSLENGETALERTGVGSNYFRVCEKAIASGDKIASEALSGMKNIFTEENSSLYLEYPCDSPETPRWFSMRGMKFESDEPMIVVSHTDITERKLTEEKLTQSEFRLNEAQAITHLGNWEIDLRSKRHSWSEEFYRIYGIEKEKYEPSTELFLSFIHPDDFEFTTAKVAQAFSTLESSSINFRFIRKDGVIRHGYTKWEFEFNKRKKPIRLYGIIQDITERKLAETEKEKMISDIIQRSKNLEQFTYIISHNLRAPIANILGIANVLKGKVTDEDRVRIQQFLFTAVEKLDNTVKDLNKILQIRSEITENKESIDLPELVQVIKSSIENLIYKENAQILVDFSLASNLKTIKSYAQSIFYNLISNAIKYKQPDKAPVMNIRSYNHDNKTFISFKDNGTGIDLKQHGDKVFGLYKRFHENIEGKGLGLFMVKTQIEVLGGRISVKSEPGMGTEFIIEFPNL